MGKTACTHNHHTTSLATRLNTIKYSTPTLNLEVLSTGPLPWDSLSMDLPQQSNLITDSHSIVNPNMGNPNIVNSSMASLKMNKHRTDSFSQVPIPCLEGNPPQNPGTTHKLG